NNGIPSPFSARCISNPPGLQNPTSHHLHLPFNPPSKRPSIPPPSVHPPRRRFRRSNLHHRPPQPPRATRRNPSNPHSKQYLFPPNPSQTLYPPRLHHAPLTGHVRTLRQGRFDHCI